MRPKLRHLMVLVAIVAVGLGVYRWLPSVSVAHWVGGFPLEVALDDRSGRSVVAVAVEPVAQMVEAEFSWPIPKAPNSTWRGSIGSLAKLSQCGSAAVVRRCPAVSYRITNTKPS
jgi:hypothetical protein